MQKKVLLFLVLQNICYVLFSQQFSTKLYFKGFANWKDTLEVGYDPTATRGVDAVFGEINCRNSISKNNFKAFIVDPSVVNPSTFLLKKQILNTYSGWVENAALGIIIPFDSLPVSVSWDKSLFEHTERDYSLITDWTMGGWFDAGSHTFKSYLKDVSLVQIPKIASNYTYDDGTLQHPMYIFYLAFAKEENIISGNKELINDSGLSIYPNPASSLISVENKSGADIKSITVFTVDGHVIEYITDLSKTKIDCTTWVKGLYVIGIETNERNVYFKIQIIN